MRLDTYQLAGIVLEEAERVFGDLLGTSPEAAGDDPLSAALHEVSVRITRMAEPPLASQCRVIQSIENWEKVLGTLKSRLNNRWEYPVEAHPTLEI